MDVTEAKIGMFLTVVVALVTVGVCSSVPMAVLTLGGRILLRQYRT